MFACTRTFSFVVLDDKSMQLLKNDQYFVDKEVLPVKYLEEKITRSCKEVLTVKYLD